MKTLKLTTLPSTPGAVADIKSFAFDELKAKPLVCLRINPQVSATAPVLTFTAYSVSNEPL